MRSVGKWLCMHTQFGQSPQWPTRYTERPGVKTENKTAFTLCMEMYICYMHTTWTRGLKGTSNTTHYIYTHVHYCTRRSLMCNKLLLTSATDKATHVGTQNAETRQLTQYVHEDTAQKSVSMQVNEKANNCTSPRTNLVSKAVELEPVALCSQAEDSI